MDYTVSFIPVTLINSFSFLFAMTNLLLYPLRFPNKFIIYIYLVLCQIFFGNAFGQNIIPFTIGGAILIIGLSNKHLISNAFFALIGYLFAIFLNYAIVSLLNIFGATAQVIYSKSSYLLTFVTLYSTITIITTYILGRYLRFLFIDKKLILNNKLQFLFALEVIICVAIFTYNITQAENKGYPSELVYFNTVLFTAFFITTLIIFFFCFHIVQKNYELENVKKEKQALEDYMTTLDTLYQETRIFKHDYMNILCTMKYYIEEADTSDLKEFFDTRILPTNKKLTGKNAIIDRLSRIRILELKGILYYKLITAMNKELNVIFEMHDDINTICMDMLDLSNIVGNYLDNAIDAAIDTEAKRLTVLLIKDHSSIVISISNSAADEEIMLEEINKADTSLKSGHSGLGLYSSNSILDKYDNIIHTTTYNEHIFTQTLEICNLP